jgi:PIN domain nuclease of toxin-antitoxin system
MADAEAAVTDTHPLLLHAAGGRGLGRKAAAFFERCERREAILYVPAAVMWECGLLARVGRVNLRRSLRAFLDDLFSNPAYQPIPLTPDEVCLADELRFTRDPFDALIVAAARNASLPLLTRDGDIRASGAVAVIW